MVTWVSKISQESIWKTLLHLLNLYLCSLLVEFSCAIFSQKAGVCIGSWVAPVLGEILLLYIDRKIANRPASLLTQMRLIIHRFVDDYLFMHHSSLKATNIVSMFKYFGGGLQFIKGGPSDSRLQFLGL